MQLETWHEDSNILSTRTRVDSWFSRGIFALPTGLNIRIVEYLDENDRESSPSKTRATLSVKFSSSEEQTHGRLYGKLGYRLCPENKFLS